MLEVTPNTLNHANSVPYPKRLLENFLGILLPMSIDELLPPSLLCG
jgi:hypothetical protein